MDLSGLDAMANAFHPKQQVVGSSPETSLSKSKNKRGVGGVRMPTNNLSQTLQNTQNHVLCNSTYTMPYKIMIRNYNKSIKKFPPKHAEKLN